DQSIAGKPVVRVNDIEGADVVLTLEYMMDEGTAHVVDFIHEIWMQIERTAMVMDAINPLVMPLSRAHSGEDMNFMTLSVQRGGQFGHMHTHAADTNRMQRFPGKHCDPHFDSLSAQRSRWQEGTFDGLKRELGCQQAGNLRYPQESYKRSAIVRH